MRLNPLIIASLIALSVLSAAPPALAADGTDLAFQQREQKLTLRDLGAQYPLKLRGVFGQVSVPLNLRNDQIVTAAELELKYGHSPSLRFDLSHLNVYVNDQLVKAIPLTAETASGTTQKITIDPNLLLPHTQIRFDLIAHYAKPNECEDPANSVLQADISNDSALRLTVASLPLIPSLSQLPAPLFDPGDSRALHLPFVFSGQPSLVAVKAAGILAAWFGAQADYRGADFPVSYAGLPPGHGVVFVTPNRSLPGLERYAAVNVPTLSVVAHPQVPGAALLVIAAPNDEGLVTAVQALVLGKLVLSGDSAAVSSLQLPAASQPWHSPRWINTEQPHLLADTAIGPLSVTGLMPGPISFEFALPPDLYPLSEHSVRAQIRYRVAPVTAARSSLNILLNNQFIGSTMLGGSQKPVRESSELDLSLPLKALQGRNRLEAQFHFKRDTKTVCEDFDASSLQGSIDPNSTITIGRFAHFSEMPALEKLANGGYPYSRLGDLSETALVLPNRYSAVDLSSALIVLGHIGRWTQDAATRLEVTTLDALPQLADRDVIVVGRLDELQLPEAWLAELPIQLDGARVSLRAPDRLEVLQGQLESRDVQGAFDYASRIVLEAQQSFAALIGFEVPGSAGHSAVLVTAGRDGDPRAAALALTEAGSSQFVRGGLTLIKSGKVSGYDLGRHYAKGHLPWWIAAQRWMTLHPYLLWPGALLLAIIVGLTLPALMRRRAQRRLKGET